MDPLIEELHSACLARLRSATLRLIWRGACSIGLYSKVVTNFPRNLENIHGLRYFITSGYLWVADSARVSSLIDRAYKWFNWVEFGTGNKDGSHEREVSWLSKILWRRCVGKSGGWFFERDISIAFKARGSTCHQGYKKKKLQFNSWDVRHVLICIPSCPYSLSGSVPVSPSILRASNASKSALPTL